MVHICIIWFCLFIATYSKGISAEGLSFNEAIEIALQQAPILTANQAQIDAARSAAIPAGALPDPQLALGLDNVPIQGHDSFNLSKDFMTMQRVGVMQTFPNLAKLDAREAVAAGKIALAQAETRIIRLQVIQDTAIAWITVSALSEQLTVLAELEHENQLFAKAIQAQYAGGTGIAADTIAPKQEAAMLAERQDELISRKSQAIAQLKRWVGDVAQQTLVGQLPNWPITEQALAHGLHRHPELDIYVPKSQVLEAEVAEAKADKIPDWAVELAYQKRGPAYSDMVSLQVNIDLPIFSDTRQQPKLEAKLSERYALDAERQASLQEHSAMLSAELAEYQRLKQAEHRANTVLMPLADDKVALTLAAWRSKQTDLASLITARKERIDNRLRAIAIKAERQQLAAKLHYNYSAEIITDSELQP